MCARIGSDRLYVHPFRETFKRAWVVMSEVNVVGSNLVALVLLNSQGITVYRHRGKIEVDKILGVIGLDYVLMRRQVFDVA